MSTSAARSPPRSSTIRSKAKFVPLDANERFKELQNRKVDILSRNSTWSMSRETNYDLYFPAVAYYDGEGFMLPRVAQHRFRAGARTAARSACRTAPRRSSTSPTISAPTT